MQLIHRRNFVSRLLLPTVTVGLATFQTSDTSPQQTAMAPQVEKPMSKTVYLIRHAESLENVAYMGARRVQASYAAKKAPELSDVFDSFKLLYKMFRPSVMNAPLSDLGRRQVTQLHHNLQKDSFLVDDPSRDFLIAHSPLARARQTAYGGLYGPEFMDDTTPPQFGKPSLELESLREVNPTEIIKDACLFLKRKTVDKRIEAFEQWIESRDEDALVVVGHSVYFKRMLNLPETFNNCDVWELEYNLADNECKEDPKRKAGAPASKGTEKTFELPRKWTSLRRLYTYTPEQIPEIDEEAGEAEPPKSF